MSTILKALKQIDQTTPPEDLQSWPPKIDTKETVKSRVQKIRLNRKVYLAALLTLLIAAGGWLFYSQKDLLLAKISSDRISENDRSASTGSPEKGPLYQAKIHPPAPKPAQMQKPSERLPGMSDRQKNDKNNLFTASGKTETLPKSTSSKSRMARSQKADQKKTSRPKTRASVASPSRKSKSALKQSSRSYRSLEESKLQLQAIAWSEDAARRIAVINGHVVREGESVEGFSVTQIRQDDIIVNDGTESWQVEFRLK